MVNRLGVVLLLGLSASALTGCVANTFRTGRPGGGGIKTDTATFYLGGLVGEKNLDLETLCPNGVSQWKDYITPTDAILSMVTCWIYMPQTIEVECAGAGPGAPKTSYLLIPEPEHNQTQVIPLDEASRATSTPGGRS